MLYNANQDRSTNQRQDMEQLRKELKKWEGEGKVKKVDIGDTDEYQVGNDWERLVPIIDPAQRLHKQDFIKLIERARRGRPHSHKSRLSQSREGDSPIEEPEVTEAMDPIEID